MRPRARRGIGALAGLASLVVATTAVAGAVPALPAGLPPLARQRVLAVAEDASLATRYSADAFPARREIFEFLLDHPEFATHVTQALRLARYRIWTTAGGLALDDGWGTTGTFEVVHAVPGRRVLYARGVYEHWLLPDIRGQAVVLLDYATAPLPGGEEGIAASLTGYVKLESPVLAATGKLASSIAHAKAEKEAERLVKVFARTTKAIAEDGNAVLEALRRRPGVPSGDLDALCRLLNVSAAAASR